MRASGQQGAQHQFGDDGRDPEGRTVSALGLEHHPVDQMTDDPRQEDHEGVDNALDEGQGHHVAVGHVTHLVGEHRLHLFAAHAVEQSRADRHQGVVARGPGGEGVHVRGIVDGHLRHTDAGLFRLTADRCHQPLLGRSARGLDDLGTDHAFGGPLRHRQGDQRTAETQHRGEDQQGVQVQVRALFVEDALHAEEAQGDAQHHDDRQVGGQEQENALHDGETSMTFKGH